MVHFYLAFNLFGAKPPQNKLTKNKRCKVAPCAKPRWTGACVTPIVFFVNRRTTATTHRYQYTSSRDLFMPCHYTSPSPQSPSRVFRLLSRRELELKSIETGVLCTELVAFWLLSFSASLSSMILNGQSIGSLFPSLRGTWLSSHYR